MRSLPAWASELFVEYPAPMKSGPRERHLCLDWQRDHRNWQAFLEAAFFRYEVTHSIYTKYRNTAEFCEYCAERAQQSGA